MPISDHLCRRRGRYWFRIRIPVDLTSRLGRNEVWRTLGTADPVVAKRRGRYMAIRATPLWDRVRHNRMLSKEQVDQLIREYFKLYLEQDQVERYSDKPDVDWKADEILTATLAFPGVTLDDFTRPEARNRGGAMHGLGLTLEEIDAAIAESGKSTPDFISDRNKWIVHVCMETALKTNDWREASLFADAYIDSHALPIEKNSEAYQRLCFGLLRAIFEATGIVLKRAEGDWSGRPKDQFFQIPTASPAPQFESQRPAPPKASPPRLSELVELFLAEKSEITKKFKDDHRASVRAYEQFLKDPAAWHLAEARDVAQFKELLLKAPANWTKIFPGKSLREAVALNEKRKSSTLAAKTINEKYLRVLNAVLRWAKSNGYADHNAADGVKVLTAKKARVRKPRHPFSPENLATIFAAPVFVGCESSAKTSRHGRHRVRDHRFWAPVIALHSGARANEIGQLRRGDVVRVDGIACFRLSDHQLKSDAAARLIPIHPNLIDLGILELAGNGQIAHSDRLFPDWSIGQDGYYSSTFSKWFARFLGSVGLKDTELVFHSFRHTFKDALREAAVSEDIQNRLMGHSSGHIGETYGHGHSATALHTAMQKLKFDGFPLAALRLPLEGAATR